MNDRQEFRNLLFLPSADFKSDSYERVALPNELGNNKREYLGFNDRVNEHS